MTGEGVAERAFGLAVASAAFVAYVPGRPDRWAPKPSVASIAPETNMFENVTTAPPDPILGITEAFLKDPNPNKINLSVGVFKDEKGTTPVLEVVKQAERRLLETEQTKNYKPITGDPAYGKLVQGLLFGEGHALITEQRAETAHTPGGTGALRVVADYLHKLHPSTKVWMSNPTWANHPKVFEAAGVTTAEYAYFDKAKNGLAFEAMLESLEQASAGDAVLLHACCHNPTGVDPSLEQWEKIAELLQRKQLLPVVDFAYQGFGAGVEEDARGLRCIAEKCPELFVCSSFSKNFGLYNERTGALTVVAKSADHAKSVISQIKICIRTNYSNPPAHGGAVVALVLGDPALRQRWEEEVAAMRTRIAGMREQFVNTLKTCGAKTDFSFITRQKGMFSFSGLNKQQVEKLRAEHGIYIVGSGRINVAGMTPSNMQPLCKAIVSVL